MLNKDELQDLFFIQHQLTDLLLNDSGLRSFAEVLNKNLSADVYIFDRFQDDLIYADQKIKKDKQFDDYLSKRELKRKDSAFKCCRNEIFEYQYQWQQEDYTELQLELGREEKVGVLTVSNYQELNEYEYRILIIVAQSLALKLHQNKLVSELAQKCSSELIEDILNNRIDDKSELIQRGQLANWDLDLNYQLYLFSIKPEKNIQTEDAYYFYEIKERVMQRLHSLLQNEISRKYILFSYKKDIVLLINYNSESRISEADIDLIQEELIEKINKFYFNIGAGSFITEVTQIADSYQQASYVLDFLEATERKNVVYNYSQLGIMRLLWQINQEELKEFTTEYLAKLIKYDKGNSTEWLDTLGVYLEEGGSIQQAAKRLFIHPNTMSYRVKRIKEILGIDLQEQEVQLNLLAAYKICRYILEDDLDL
ncbi:CdaR family transcriptional regulator [Halanaerobium saccharolyticum]|uniref:CdaR family transcriptional regulator n=1 Tax=Halanaerobium saccharolyticum TaxID=43595 RepID=A0A4V3G5Y5_9FIRM|nr:helix-turn-helix domain-containing protein [Halanaerobium saccharolyticum]RAK08623.1 CdaR family transcriptional regulator [Halanaerobium saccharolyticum]TDW07234.1 CdaR family transcriptional regulator [Halanaerobium saccharolyticum]TDX60175.1 CdaR family transcriptional regulator [Halanaerobium saccharolyticum]